MTSTSLRTYAFEELGSDLLYDILRLRVQIFVVEQDCPYEEIDGVDRQAHHHCMNIDDLLVGYARTFSVVDSGIPSVQIGRVLVAKEHRRQGWATLLMLYVLDHCRVTYGREAEICLSAQTSVTDLYRSLGFIPVGEIYIEDGIPHQKMVNKSSQS